MNTRPLFLVLSVLAAAHAWSAGLSGQVVMGQVFDSIGGTPVGTGFVVLLDNRGIEVARTLSDLEGRFVIHAAAPGRYRLRSERIGYEPWETPAFTLAGSDTLEQDLRVAAIPVRLTAIDVRGEAKCGLPEPNSDVGHIWQEVQKALRAAAWSAEHQPYRYRIHKYERDVSATPRRVLRENVGAEWGYYRIPATAWEPDSLVARGYVVERSDGPWYYGPDAEVLFDDTFHSTHCFKGVRGEGAASHLIGLAFEPAPGRELPDVAGTLWVDETSSELRSIEYRYTELPFPIRDTLLGGTVEFMRVPSGAWIVAGWEIRMPLTVEERTRLVDRETYLRARPQRANRLAAYRQGGEHVIQVEDFDGQQIYVSPDLVVVRGTVFDSIRGRSLEGERVSIVGTGYETATDDDGAFELAALLDGDYVVTSARMDSLGYLPGRIPVRFAPADTIRLALVIPELDTVKEALCPDRSDENVLFGTVWQSRRREPFPYARVRASWVTSRTPAGYPGDRKREIQADAAGRYVLCDLPPYETMTVELVSESQEIEPTVVEFHAGQVRVGSAGVWQEFDAPEGIWRLDLKLRSELDTPR